MEEKDKHICSYCIFNISEYDLSFIECSNLSLSCHFCNNTAQCDTDGGVCKYIAKVNTICLTRRSRPSPKELGDMTAGTVHPWMPEESINGSTNSATIEVGNSPLTIQELLHGHIVDDFLGVFYRLE